MRFQDQVILISGGGSGIGQHIAWELADEGAQVVVVDINAEGLSETERARSNRVHVHLCDVRDDDGVRQVVAETMAQFGRIDGLVHSAYWTDPKPLLETGPEEFQKTQDVVLKGAYLLARHILPVMLQQGRGVIVPIASVHSVLGFRNFFAYQVAKAGLLGYVRSIAVDYGPAVRAVALAPGAIDTPALHDTSEEVRATLAQGSLAKRIGTAHDVARAASFLLSDESSFMTGTMLLLDGGWSVL